MDAINPSIEKSSVEERKDEGSVCTNQYESVEEEISNNIDIMKSTLSRQEGPNFKDFWTARKKCLSLFREISASSKRSVLWKSYIDLTKEGRRLTNLLDTGSSYTVDQIELAVSSLEKDLDAFNDSQKEFFKKKVLSEFPRNIKSLGKNLSYYALKYPILFWLNSFVVRIIDFRKELITTTMRLRFKNKFFQRLSKMGDVVFPLRKALIAEVSEVFQKDVKEFVDAYFEESENFKSRLKKSVFFLRSEIKGLQNVAKILILNSQVFGETRALLSSCWDKLKGIEKEIKKEQSENKKVSLENSREIFEKIEHLLEKLKNSELTLSQGEEELRSCIAIMRKTVLVHQDVLKLKEEIKKVEKILNLRKDQHDFEKKKLAEEKEFLRKEKVSELNQELISLEDSKEFSDEVELFKKKLIGSSFLTKIERQGFEKRIKTLKEQIVEQEEKKLLLLSDDDKETYNNLLQVLNQRKERRKVLKNQLEDYRKTVGGSGFDFEKAMQYNNLISMEKEKLLTIDQSIEELEEKLASLRRKLSN